MVRRGKVYYAKLARGKTMFVAPRLVPAFRAVWGMARAEEKARLTADARAILKVLRREWEMGTADLREESGVADRKRFTRALDELQAALIVIPSEVYYQPKFTYIWTLAVGRFPDALTRRMSRAAALRTTSAPLFRRLRRRRACRCAGYASRARQECPFASPPG